MGVELNDRATATEIENKHIEEQGVLDSAR